MRTLTKEEIILSFSKKDVKKLKLPDFNTIEWKNIDYLGWVHPSGHLGFMVYELDSTLIGLVLDKTTPGTKNAKMCSLCLTIHNGRGVSIFSTQVKSKPNTKHGIYVCSDLQCSLYVRNKKNFPANQMRETISMDDKILRLNSNLDNFFRGII